MGSAYAQLADIMISAEANLYRESSAQPGGWRGFKAFRVDRKVQESQFMTSFYLTPKDGMPLPTFQPGQYLSIKVHPVGFEYDQIRQYSLSCASNGHHSD